MKSKILSSLAAVGVGLGMALASASASAAITWFSPITFFEDDDLDYFQDRFNEGGVACGGTTGVTCNGTIDVGDVFIAIAEWHLTAPTSGGAGVPIGPEEVTAYAEAQVTSVTPVGGGNINITVGPTGNLGAGVMVQIYSDPTPDLDVINAACGTLAQCTALATDGTLLAEAGFAGDPDELWSINNVPSNPFLLLNVAAGTARGQYNFGLSLITDNTGQNLGPQDCTPGLDCTGLGDAQVDVIGSGSFLGGCGLPGTSPNPTTGSCVGRPINPVDGLFARSDTDFQVAPQLPEPGSIALVALGALLIGATWRSRAKQ